MNTYWATTGDVEVATLTAGDELPDGQEVDAPLALSICAPGGDAVTVIEGDRGELLALLDRMRDKIART